MSKDLAACTLIDHYGAMLTEHQRDIVTYYYFDDLSLAEIAENEGITREAVRDIIKRSLQQLGDMEQKLGFIAKTESVSAAVSLIRKAAENLSDSDSRNTITALCDTVLD